MTETGGQPPVSSDKDVAVLLFLLRRLTRRGRNAAVVSVPRPAGTGRALYCSRWHR
ncbi:hypothetical protein ECZU29_62610 [Escherichia coli]|nr:hypothetical protein ECZU29_62610 [Escherichia coli]